LADQRVACDDSDVALAHLPCFKQTADGLTAASLSNMGRTGNSSVSPTYYQNPYGEYNQWTQDISTPMGQESQDLRWLIG
jgi:hypothetical protein